MFSSAGGSTFFDGTSGPVSGRTRVASASADDDATHVSRKARRSIVISDIQGGVGVRPIWCSRRAIAARPADASDDNWTITKDYPCGFRNPPSAVAANRARQYGRQFVDTDPFLETHQWRSTLTQP